MKGGEIMNQKYLLDVICDPVAINAGLAVFFGLLARSTALGDWDWSFNSRGKRLSLPIASAVLWGLAIIFAVAAFTTYLPPSNVREKQGLSELMMAFVGVAFAMFTGIAVLMLSESRKDLANGLSKVESAQANCTRLMDEISRQSERSQNAFRKFEKGLEDLVCARQQWNELPSHLNLLRTGAIASTSIRYVSAVACPPDRACALDVVVCDIVRKVIDRATVEEIRLDEDRAVSALKTIWESADVRGDLAKPEWLPIRRYFLGLHQELKKSDLTTSKSAVLLGKILADLDGGGT